MVELMRSYAANYAECAANGSPALRSLWSARKSQPATPCRWPVEIFERNEKMSTNQIFKSSKIQSSTMAHAMAKIQNSKVNGVICVRIPA